MGSGGKEQTVGYRYFMGLHFGVCMGPVDAVLAIKGGDRVAWEGSVTSSQQIAINAPNLFGGEEKEGGIAGTLDLMFGEPSQAVNDYLAAKQGMPQPAYRGILSAVFRQGLVGCNNPYIKQWAFKVRRILQGWQGGASAWYPEKAEIMLPSGDRAMNPAHIYYECLTNQVWGMGYGAAQVDDANFRAAADVFHAEGLGLCIKWTRQETIENFLSVINDHAGVVLRQNKRTGLFELKPIRADYDVEDLPVFDESSILSLESYQRPGLTDTTNEITVSFVDVMTGRDGSVTVQNLANITAQGGVVSQGANYPGIPSADLAIRVALRDLHAVSTPLAKVRFKVNRKAWKVLPGDVIRLSWRKLGIENLVLRVLRVNDGTLASGAIDVEAAEDVFGLPASGYAQQQPVGWQSPNTLPAPATLRLVDEAPYYELVRSLPRYDLDTLPEDAGYLATLAARPSADSVNYGIVTRPSGSGSYAEGGEADFCPTGTLAEAIGPTDTSAVFENIVDGDLIEAGTYAILGAETIRIDAFDPLTGAATIGRGVLDTVAAAHEEGERCYFADGYVGSDELERIAGEAVDVKLLPSTGLGRLTEGSAPADVVEFDYRAHRPYPPGRVQINGQRYPETIEGQLELSWAHRDRTQQNLEGDESGDIGPEAGTTYSIIFRALKQFDVGQEVTLGDIAFGNGLFVATARGGAAAVSEDGVEWRKLYPFPQWEALTTPDIAFDGSKFIAQVYDLDALTLRVATSIDGESWTEVPAPAVSAGWRTLVNGKFLGLNVSRIDTGGAALWTIDIMSSANGIDWVSRRTINSSRVPATGAWGFLYADGEYRLYGVSPATVYTSPDGETWDATPMSYDIRPTNWLNFEPGGCFYNGSVFVQVTINWERWFEGGGRALWIYSSVDGINWTLRHETDYGVIAHTGSEIDGTFLVVTIGRFLVHKAIKSDDGVAWVDTELPLPARVNTLRKVGARLFIGDESASATTIDGVSWQEVDLIDETFEPPPPVIVTLREVEGVSGNSYSYVDEIIDFESPVRSSGEVLVNNSGPVEPTREFMYAEHLFIELWSSREGLDSRQRHDVAVVRELVGYGYSYGERYGE